MWPHPARNNQLHTLIQEMRGAGIHVGFFAACMLVPFLFMNEALSQVEKGAVISYSV
jgi:hypothetical protein